MGFSHGPLAVGQTTFRRIPTVLPHSPPKRLSSRAVTGPRARKAERTVTAAVPKLMHAGELARLAGLHKTTVLQAVRRGEIRVSRTVGRSVRIALADAAAFLGSRGITLADALATPTEPRRVVLLTERADLHRRFAESLPHGWSLTPHQDLYDALLALGACAPAALVLDLAMVGLNPDALARAIRTNPALGRVPLLAISRFEAPSEGSAQPLDVALHESDAASWHAALAALD